MTNPLSVLMTVGTHALSVPDWSRTWQPGLSSKRPLWNTTLPHLNCFTIVDPSTVEAEQRLPTPPCGCIRSCHRLLSSPSQCESGRLLGAKENEKEQMHQLLCHASRAHCSVISIPSLTYAYPLLHRRSEASMQSHLFFRWFQNSISHWWGVSISMEPGHSGSFCRHCCSYSRIAKCDCSSSIIHSISSLACSLLSPSASRILSATALASSGGAWVMW